MTMNTLNWMLLAAAGLMAAGFVYLKILVMGLQTEVRRLRRQLEEQPQAAPAAATTAAVAPPASPGVERVVEVAVEHAFRDQMRRLLEHTLEDAGSTPALKPDKPGTAANDFTPPPPVPRQPRAPRMESVPVPQPAAVPAASAAAADPAEQRWNPERRFRIISMAERGEQPESIAAALRIPVSEVELFLRIHQIARS